MHRRTTLPRVDGEKRRGLEGQQHFYGSTASVISRTELLFCDPRGYGIPATPCQRACCRLLDGVPLGDLWEDPQVRLMCGGVEPAEGRPDQFVLTKAPRSGGSLLFAAWAINRALYCDLETGDLKRIAETENPPILPVVSVHVKNARAIVGHVKQLMSRPNWQEYLIGKATKDEVRIRHLATGTPIAIQVVAGSRSASNLESYWCVSVVFDEVFKLLGEDEAVVNLDDARVAVRGRILPGGQIGYVGSPWAPVGPAYELLERYWQKPCKECLAVKTTGPMFHPKKWSPETIAALQSSDDQRDRDVAVLAMGEFISRTTGLLTEQDIHRCCTHGAADVPPRSGVRYVATIDPALRRNAWTLVVAHREGPKLVADLARQWMPRPGLPLRAGTTLAQVATLVRPYGVRELHSDQWSSETLKELAEPTGLKLVELQLRGVKAQNALWALVNTILNGAAELPEDKWVVTDLTFLRRKVGQGGPVLFLQATPDGRHADYVPALMMSNELLPNVAPPTPQDFPDDFIRPRKKPAEPFDPVENMAVMGDARGMGAFYRAETGSRR